MMPDRDEFTDYANSQVRGERIVPEGVNGFKAVPIYASELCASVGCELRALPDGLYCRQCRDRIVREIWDAEQARTKAARATLIWSIVSLVILALIWWSR